MIDNSALKAEEEGFEPPVHRCTTVFKTVDTKTQTPPDKELTFSSNNHLQASLQTQENSPTPLPTELIEIIKSWDELPDHIKQTIQTLVGSVSGKSEEISK